MLMFIESLSQNPFLMFRDFTWRIVKEEEMKNFPISQHYATFEMELDLDTFPHR